MGEQRTKKQLSVLVWALDGANVSLRVHNHERTFVLLWSSNVYSWYTLTPRNQEIHIKVFGVDNTLEHLQMQVKIFPESIYLQSRSSRNGTKSCWTQAYTPKMSNICEMGFHERTRHKSLTIEIIDQNVTLAKSLAIERPQSCATLVKAIWDNPNSIWYYFRRIVWPLEHEKM